MRPFPFPELVWATDATTSEPVTKWHVYAYPDLMRDTALAELVDTAQQVAEKAAPGCVVPPRRTRPTAARAATQGAYRPRAQAI